MKTHAIRLGLALSACVALLAACSGSQSGGGEEPPKIEPLGALGQNEGELNLIAWAGYAENGTNDPAVNWASHVDMETGRPQVVREFSTRAGGGF